MVVVGGGCRFAGLRRKRCEFVGGERERDTETMVLKTCTVKEPKKRLITDFLVRPGSDRWSNR